jgi:GR25 family glycosyltransferase involved in LPS biosynthesis
LNKDDTKNKIISEINNLQKRISHLSVIKEKLETSKEEEAKEAEIKEVNGGAKQIVKEDNKMTEVIEIQTISGQGTKDREGKDGKEGKEVSQIVKMRGAVCGIPQVDKIFCINLQSCKERKDHMKKEFSKNQFNATFVNAIHPRHAEHKKKYTNAKFVDQGWNQPRCYCIQKCDHRHRKLRATEVAISLSHNNIYLSIINNRYKWSLVCEDDLIFAKNFCEIVNSLVPPEVWKHQAYQLSEEDKDREDMVNAESGERPIIIFLGGASDNMRLEKTNVEQFKFMRMSRGIYSNYCYLINLEAAKFLSRKFYPIIRPEDSFKRYWISKGRLDCYRVSPSIIAELSAGTNMPAIYNRWSLGKVAPGTSGQPDKEYKKVEMIQPNLNKPRRKITYSKFTDKLKK